MQTQPSDVCASIISNPFEIIFSSTTLLFFSVIPEQIRMPFFDMFLETSSSRFNITSVRMFAAIMSKRSSILF
ncbi:MAG: hypothetical protein V1874_07210 [Spirochaetota bacterium]